VYQVVLLDLNNVIPIATPKLLVPAGKRIAEVFALSVAAGASFRMRFGQGDMFTIAAPFTFEPTGDDDNNNGLYVDNAAAVNAIVEIVIVFAKPGSSGLNPILP
jgi:hypothetical protein